MTDSDQAKADRLKKWRAIALLALVFAGILFIVGRIGENSHPAWGWVRAFGEAAMVGALADWFAVVALFRHPMGIPFYHTAVVRLNHHRIAHSIGTFFIRHFWQRDVLKRFVTGRRFASHLASLLEDRREEWAAAMPGQLNQLLKQMPESALQEPVQQFAKGVVSRIDLAPLSARLLEALLQRGVQQELIRVTTPAIAETVRENREFLEKKIREEVPLPDEMPLRIGAFRMPAEVAEEWFKSVKSAIAAYVAERVVDKTEVTLREVERDEQHPIRQAVDSRLQKLADDLRQDPAMQEQLEQWRQKLIESETWNDAVTGLTKQIREWLEKSDEEPLASAIRGISLQAIDYFAQELAQETGLGGQVDELLRERLIDVALEHQDAIHELLVQTVKEWPVEKISGQMELELGADLQFIRLNGTLVGGVVGLALHAISLLLA